AFPYALFPPPPAGALGFARLDGPGAGGAADAGEASSVEGMNGNTVVSRVLFDLSAGPVGKRIELQAAAGLFHFADARARLGLFPAQAGGPSLKFGKL